MKLVYGLVLMALGCGGSDGGGTDSADAGEPGGDAASETDASLDASTPPDIGTDPVDGGSTDIAFSLPPPGTTYVSGTVTLQIVVTGADADRVELWRNGSALATLPLPYTYAWDTSLEDEGTYEMEARAIRGGATIASATRTFVIDRTAPTIVSREPAPDSASVRLAQPIRIEFSEPIDPGTVDDTTVLLMAGDEPLPHDRTISADMMSIELTPTDAPTVLPAVTTVEVLGSVADPAGNTLGETDSFTFTYPAWLEAHDASSLPSTLFVRDVAIAPDGTAWIAYFHETSASPYLYSFEVAYWDGAAWSRAGDPLLTDISSVHHAKLLFRSASELVVLAEHATGSDTSSALWVWDTTDWSTAGPPPPRGDEYSDSFDAELESSGDIVLARRIGNDLVAHRLSAATWSEVAPAFSITGSRDFIDVLTDGGEVVVSYYSSYSCSAVRDLGGTWQNLGYIHRGFNIYSECVSAHLARAGDVLHALTFHKNQTGTYSSSQTGAVKRRTSSWTNVSGFPATDGYLGVAATSTGFLAASMDPTSGIAVVDETGTALGGALAGTYVRILARGDEPVLVMREASFFERNTL